MISPCQLLKKNRSMNLVNREFEVYDANARLILKAHLSSNKTFKIDINVLDHKRFASITNLTMN